MNRPKASAPVDRARVVRLTIDLVRTVTSFSDEVWDAGEDLDPLWGILQRFKEESLTAAIRVPGVRIAVFPIEDKTSQA